MAKTSRIIWRNYQTDQNTYHYHEREEELLAHIINLLPQLSLIYVPIGSMSLAWLPLQHIWKRKWWPLTSVAHKVYKVQVIGLRH